MKSKFRTHLGIMLKGEIIQEIKDLAIYGMKLKRVHTTRVIS